MISVRFQGKSFNIMVIQACAPTSNAEEAEVERFYEDLQDILELTPPKDVIFIVGDWNAKVRRNTWSNTQIWPWSTEWSRAKANKVLPREHTGHSKHPLPPTQQQTLHMDIIRLSILKSDWYILCSWRWRSSIELAKMRPGPDCGPDHELFVAKFRLKLKKVVKTTRPFKSDLNQFPYDYTEEVTNRCKGLDLIHTHSHTHTQDLIDRVPEELWM